MELTSHYEQLLGFDESWAIKSANLDLSGGSPFFFTAGGACRRTARFLAFPDILYTPGNLQSTFDIGEIPAAHPAASETSGGTRRIAWWH